MGQDRPRRGAGLCRRQSRGLGSALATAALKEWAGRSLTDAGAWLAGANPETRNRLSAPLVQAWAQQDASSALAWCQANLTGTPLAQAVGGVIKGAAETDVNAAAGLVAAMSPSAARTEAALAVAQKWFPGLLSDQTVKPETIAWLAGLDTDSIRHVVEEFQWQWATSDAKSMTAFLAAAKPEGIPAGAYSILARQLARNNPLETLDWASHLPAEWALSAASAAFGEWRGSQPDAAVKWLNDLPATEPRRQPCFEASIRILAYDQESQAADQLAALNPADRAAAQHIIEGISSLSSDHRTRLLEALKPH